MTTNTNTIEKSRTYYLVINALFIALTLVATWLINIRLPFMGSGGLIHLARCLFSWRQCCSAERQELSRELSAWGCSTS